LQSQSGHRHEQHRGLLSSTPDFFSTKSTPKHHSQIAAPSFLHHKQFADSLCTSRTLLSTISQGRWTATVKRADPKPHLKCVCWLDKMSNVIITFAVDNAT
jgi:hypothetical protein